MPTEPSSDARCPGTMTNGHPCILVAGHDPVVEPRGHLCEHLADMFPGYERAEADDE